MLDMMNMMGKVKEMQARLKEAQDNLVNVKATGESGGGMVKAVVNGKKQVLSIEIDPTLLKKEDQTILQDLIVAAVNKASDEAELLAKEELRKSTEGILPNIPGLDLSNLMR
ncbi:MAG TPA: YbaB/EbfC family nucleoid-associated protein [Cyclobacteriaceae bacterium]|nr:YbaB/EbfC family nucleoid-associated protein [Cyclobacteriaceae bacterium]